MEKFVQALFGSLLFFFTPFGIGFFCANGICVFSAIETGRTCCDVAAGTDDVVGEAVVEVDFFLTSFFLLSVS